MIISNILDRFQLKFKDRESAGNLLGDSLKSFIKKDERKHCIVLGIPRGGVITGWAIAKKLSCDFGLVMTRKLRAPNNEELAIGAITDDETTYLNYKVIKCLKISVEYLEKEKSHQLQEIKRRNRLLLTSKMLNWNRLDLSMATIIVVDDGAASGSTIIATVRRIRTNSNPKRIMVAVPVVPNSTLELLKKEGLHHIEVITNAPDNKFESVERYYRDFTQLNDDEVARIVQRITEK